MKPLHTVLHSHAHMSAAAAFRACAGAVPSRTFSAATAGTHVSKPDLLLRIDRGAPALGLYAFTLAATEAIGHTLAQTHKRGDVILLKGSLGAGKTVFARGYVRGATGDANLEVTSPTFLLDNTYITKKGITLHHMDMYRLRGEADATMLGLSHMYTHDVCVIEWPQRLGASIPEEHLLVHIMTEEDKGFPRQPALQSAMMNTLGAAVANLNMHIAGATGTAPAPTSAGAEAAPEIAEDTLKRAIIMQARGQRFIPVLEQLRRELTAMGLPIAPLS